MRYKLTAEAQAEVPRDRGDPPARSLRGGFALTSLFVFCDETGQQDMSAGYDLGLNSGRQNTSAEARHRSGQFPPYGRARGQGGSLGLRLPTRGSWPRQDMGPWKPSQCP